MSFFFHHRNGAELMVNISSFTRYYFFRSERLNSQSGYLVFFKYCSGIVIIKRLRRIGSILRKIMHAAHWDYYIFCVHLGKWDLWYGQKRLFISIFLIFIAQLITPLRIWIDLWILSYVYKLYLNHLLKIQSLSNSSMISEFEE